MEHEKARSNFDECYTGPIVILNHTCTYITSYPFFTRNPVLLTNLLLSRMVPSLRTIRKDLGEYKRQANVGECTAYTGTISGAPKVCNKHGSNKYHGV